MLSLSFTCFCAVSQHPGGCPGYTHFNYCYLCHVILRQPDHQPAVPGRLMLGLGSLVDFSVVVWKYLPLPAKRLWGCEAAGGTAEVGNAVTASALAQVVVFLPIVFVQGLAGILFKPLALTVSFLISPPSLLP